MRFLKQMNEGLEKPYKKLKSADGKSVNESLKKKSIKELKEDFNNIELTRIKNELINQLKKKGYSSCARELKDYDLEILSNSNAPVILDAKNLKIKVGDSVPYERVLKDITRELIKVRESELG